MHGSSRTQILPPLPPVAKFVLLGVFVAFAAYVVMFLERSGPAVPEVPEPPPAQVTVPQLDRELLAKAQDGSREQRLLTEVEPFRHLLQVAIDVTPTVATALGMPEQPVAVAELRADHERWRSQWLWYAGVLEELSDPRPGHPIPGLSIYEATIRLDDGNQVFAAFSNPPDKAIRIGSWVRSEGFLMKLRDTNYPREIAEAPLLVGRQLQLDYKPWGKITELDHALLDTIDDQQFWPGSLSFRHVDEDQTEVLWHLAAYARDTQDRWSFAKWRKVTALNVTDVYDKVRENALPRGEPMRILGTLVVKHTIAAPPNPAGVKYWTSALVQARDFGGHVIPIWIPDRADDVPLRSSVEVGSFYYRWYCYDTEKQRIRVPLFVAAKLTKFELKTDETMKAVGLTLLVLLCGLIVLFWWTQRRQAGQSLAHSRHLDDRRRKRREQALAADATPQP